MGAHGIMTEIAITIKTSMTIFDKLAVFPTSAKVKNIQTGNPN
jgi:hypothetical protein